MIYNVAFFMKKTHRPTLVIIGDLYENKINTVDKTIRLNKVCNHARYIALAETL